MLVIVASTEPTFYTNITQVQPIQLNADYEKEGPHKMKVQLNTGRKRIF